MWVVKLGGSLAGGPALHAWIEALDACDAPLVVVPGGGPFADAVRAAQRRWHFDDVAAHRMALLAMEQYAWMLCALGRRLRATDDPDAMAAILRSGRVPVWLPGRALRTAQEIEPSWRVTSDSLAAWLCRRLGAAGLVLVKSAPLDGIDSDLDALVARGLLDRAFATWGRRCGAPIRLLGADQSAGLAALAAGGAAASMLPVAVSSRAS